MTHGCSFLELLKHKKVKMIVLSFLFRQHKGRSRCSNRRRLKAKKRLIFTTIDTFSPMEIRRDVLLNTTDKRINDKWY